MKQAENTPIEAENTGFHKFAWIRIIAGVLIAAGLIWGIIFVLNLFGSNEGAQAPRSVSSRSASRNTSAGIQQEIPGQPSTSPSGGETADHGTPLPPPAPHGAQAAAESVKGVAFVEAVIKPISYELNDRFWGWRPNDILNFTDNVNNFQLGVLETTRRAITRLTDNISRTGSATSLNNHLERAMNLFMINADSYILPSAEHEYRQAIYELNIYKQQLMEHRASFYSRPDNLIPLLRSFEELLGGCDENLIKLKENGKPVSTFRADDYFYYAKGVASAMATILPAVAIDFDPALKVRNGDEILHRAIESCQIAASIDPWLWVTEGSLSGIFANHRANMAAHISLARFYVGLLAEAIST